MNKIINFQKIKYFACLFPLTYLVGIAVTEFIAMGLIVFYFFHCKNKEINFKDFKIIFILLFSVYLAVNAIIQIDDNLKYSSIFYFRFLLFAIAISYIFSLLEEDSRIKQNILKVIFVILVFILMDSQLQFFYGKNFFGFEIINNRISSIFGSELILGSFLIKLLPIILFLIFFYKIDINNNKSGLVIFFGFYLIAIYLSAERTSFALMVTFISLLFFLIQKFRSLLLKSISILIVFILVTSIFELGKSQPSKRLFFKTFNQLTNEIFIKKGGEKITEIKKDKLAKNLKIFSNDHNGHLKLAYDLFKKNTIFGVGPKGFRHYCRSVNYDSEIGICSTHPHNTLIQILAETGLIGFLFYISAIFFILFKIFKSYSSYVTQDVKNYFLIVSIALLINLFPFLPSGNFFNNWISLINFYLVGIYFYAYKKVFV
jgi:O-antigen ligase